MKIHSRVSGKFKVEAITLDDSGNELSRRTVADWFPNLITDAGLNMLGSYNFAEITAYCMVGTSGSTPNISDTTLTAQIASTSTIQTSFGGVQPSSPYYVWMRRTYRFAAGDAAGNLAELGVGRTSTAVFSHALILDGLGDPTTITILPTETLDVTWELQMSQKSTDDAGVVTLAGSKGGDFNWIMRSANITTYSEGSGWILLNSNLGSMFWNRSNTQNSFVYNDEIGAITTIPTGTSDSLGLGAFVAQTYVTNSHQIVFNASVPTSIGNLTGGIRSLLVPMGPGIFQFRFGRASDDSTIDKTNVDSLSLSIFHSWGRV